MSRTPLRRCARIATGYLHLKICQLCAIDFTMFHLLRPVMHVMREAGHEVVGICSDGLLLDDIRAEGFRVETAPIRRSLNPLFHLKAFMVLVRFFRRERFDVVHTHTPAASLSGRLAAAVAGVPLIAYTAHGFYFHENMPWAKRWFFIAIEWVAGRFTDVLMTQSEEDVLSARRYRLCGGSVVEAIGNGSDPTRFRPSEPDDALDREAFRQNLGAGPRDVVIVTIGRLVREKGYPELFEAMRGLDARLWVVGERHHSEYSDPLEDFTRSLADEAWVRDRIRLLGGRRDIPEILRAADIFVLPSHREGMPRSIIEAMLTALPVVATDIRGCREEVVDNETGSLVPVNSIGPLQAALQRVVEDPELRRAFGAAGLKRARALFVEDDVLDRQLRVLGLAPVGEPERSVDAPTVSVITACYNAERFLEAAVRSVQAQTYGDWELLIVDDGSTDDSYRIAIKLAEADKRIVVLRHQRNLGAAAARNAALERARGRYMAFLDADDLWLPEKLRLQLATMEAMGAAFCYGSFKRMSENGHWTGRLIKVPSRMNHRKLLHNTAIATLTAVVDTARTGPIRMVEGVGYDDFALWLLLTKRGFLAVGLRQDLGRYRVVGGSLSSRPFRAALWVWRIYRRNERLGLPAAAWALANYGSRAAMKRVVLPW